MWLRGCITRRFPLLISKQSSIIRKTVMKGWNCRWNWYYYYYRKPHKQDIMSIILKIYSWVNREQRSIISLNKAMRVVVLHTCGVDRVVRAKLRLFLVRLRCNFGRKFVYSSSPLESAIHALSQNGVLSKYPIRYSPSSMLQTIWYQHRVSLMIKKDETEFSTFLCFLFLKKVLSHDLF